MRIVEPSASLLNITTDALQLIELAGRVCYKSEDRITASSAEAFVRDRLTSQPPHEAVIEHAVATFRFVCDRGVSHELVRHRLMSLCQESTRYCNYGKGANGIAVVMPSGMDSWQTEVWTKAMENAEGAYLALIASGASPQVARHVLPLSLKTEVVATANFREWRHVLRLRTAKAAHPHIRLLMRMVRDILAAAVPVIVEDIGTEDVQ